MEFKINEVVTYTIKEVPNVIKGKIFIDGMEIDLTNIKIYENKVTGETLDGKYLFECNKS